jgi:CBS domain-containing protein
VLRVADIMTRSVVTLAPDESLSHAAETLSNLGVSGAPVCDEGHRVIGVFSKSDLVDGLIDGKLDPSAKVGDLMTNVSFSLVAEDTVVTAAKLMADKSIHRVLVLDAEKHVVGIVSPLDILKAIRDGKLRLE